MKRIISTIIVLLVFNNNLISQTNANNFSNLIGEWIKITAKKNEFYLIDCDNKSTLILKEKEIIENDIFENTSSQIFKCIQKDIVVLYLNKQNTNYIKIQWIDKKKKIIKIQSSSENFIPKYYIFKNNINSIKKIKATKENCFDSNDVGDKVDDTFTFKSYNVSIENSNCISIRDKQDNISFEDCYDNSILKIRHKTNNCIPITLINGNKSLDLNIIQENNKWIISNGVFYEGKTKTNINTASELKNFDFDSYINSNRKETNNIFQNQNLKKLQDKNYLKDLDVYKISDILTKNPINTENLVIYNDAAFNLINLESYNEARIILLEIVKKYPSRTVAWLNLGDAQFGFDDINNAKISYKKYITLMKSQNKDLTKIPTRVYDRIK